MQKTIEELILSELNSIKKEISGIKGEMKNINERIDNLERQHKELKQYVDEKLENSTQKLKEYVNDSTQKLKEYVDDSTQQLKEYVDDLTQQLKQYVDKRINQSTKEISEELISTLDVISRTTNAKISDKQLIKEIEELKKKLERKTKEDKESFKANGARLNKMELSQEYFESKLNDIQNNIKKEKVAI